MIIFMLSNGDTLRVQPEHVGAVYAVGTETVILVQGKEFGVRGTPAEVANLVYDALVEVL